MEGDKSRFEDTIELKTTISKSESSTSETDVVLICQPCDRDNQVLPAAGYCTDCEEHLCQSCFESHRKVRPCRGHSLLDKDSMPKVIHASTDPHLSRGIDDLPYPCQKHTKENIKFFCQKHDVLACSVCVTLEHKTCNVGYIPDLAARQMDDKKLQNLIEAMDSLVSECTALRESKTKYVEKSDESLNKALTDMKKIRTDIDKRLNAAEADMEKHVQNYINENSNALQKVRSVTDDVTSALQTEIDILKQLDESTSPVNLFIKLKKCQTIIQDNRKALSDIQEKCCAFEYRYRRNESLTGLLENEDALGTVEQAGSDANVPMTSVTLDRNKEHTMMPSKSLDVSGEMNAVSPPTISNPRELPLKTDRDTMACFITGITLISSNQLVLVDRNNKCVKLLNVETEKIVSTLVLSSGPLNVAALDSNTVVVTMPKERSIKFVSVHDKVCIKSSIQVEGLCCGICCFHGKLVVGFQKPAKLQILDMTGIELDTVTKDGEGRDVFGYPNYITAGSSYIYVSDFEKQAVIRLTWHGEITGIYTGAVSCRGLVMCNDDTLYVCDGIGGCIHVIHNDFSHGRVVLTGVAAPQALCKGDHCMYISSSSNDNKRNFIQRYTVLA